ncbi:sister chromatid cohesion protein Dcc1 [Limtongia smithiae]|uniref:sister chromatid cohesion protein Dcc1 n=1 Tax=Limtongia smithiae TaxID=1125753 RepID=UPI0034CE35E8
MPAALDNVSSSREVRVYSTSAIPLPQYRLVQLPPDLLALLTDSSSPPPPLVLRSQSLQTPTYLCARDTVFQLREVSQSNALLLLTPDPAADDEVRATPLHGGYIELIPHTPNIDLSFVPYYHGPHSICITPMISLSLAAVAARVPSSRTAFSRAWTQACGVEIDGVTYRLHDQDVVAKLLPMMLTAVQASGLDPCALEASAVAKAVRGDDEPDENDEPDCVVEAILRRFSTTPSAPYKLDTAALARWFGLTVLAEHADHSTDTAAFTNLWIRALPPLLLDSFPDSTPPLSLLAGECVQPTPNTVVYLPSRTLPIEPAARLKRLFSVRTTWPSEELAEFMRDIEPVPSRVDALFTKHARRKVVKGKAFISRR